MIVVSVRDIAPTYFARHRLAVSRPYFSAREMLTYDGDRPILDNAWAIYRENRNREE